MVLTVQHIAVFVLCCLTNTSLAEHFTSGAKLNLNTAARASNALSYIYIAGVEGVGHHAVTPAIATIAVTCNKHVMYETRKLRSFQQRKSTEEFQDYLKQLRSVMYSKDVVIIDDVSFPSGMNYRGPQDKEVDGQYDINWLHRATFNNSHQISAPQKRLLSHSC